MQQLDNQPEQIEQLAERIWSEWLNRGDTMRIAEQFGYPPNQYGYYTALDEVKWSELPDNVKDHVRAMAEKEMQVLKTPPTEAEQYLITLLRELERLRPAAGYGVASHGILWDQTRERLLLVINIGDCVYLHRLYPGDLTGDPVAAAASLMDSVKTEIKNPDADVVGFKR